MENRIMFPVPSNIPARLQKVDVDEQLVDM